MANEHGDEHHFHLYNLVEVRRHQPGYEDSYYPAIIISEEIGNGHNIRYRTLYQEHNDERVTEWVHVNLIRPKPRTVMLHQFPIGVSVDAYYEGGWRKGTVTTRTAQGYVIRFRHIPGHHQYHFHELRLNQRWRRANNSWTYTLGRNVPQVNQITVTVTVYFFCLAVPVNCYNLTSQWANGEYYQFQVNDDVEIRGHEDGFMDSFYSATIISPEMDNEYHTRYRTLNNDHNNQRLTQRLHTALLRPKPLPVDFRYFDIGTTVEAYDNGGWWKGTIEASLANEYLLSFDRYPGTSQYNVHDLRIYQEWNRLNNSWTYT